MTTRILTAPDASVRESFALGPDGTRLYVRRRPGPSGSSAEGRRPPTCPPLTAVLCDGIVCDGFIYKYLWEDLGRFVSVAHWNYRGHGRSALPADPDRISVEDHGADLDAVRRHIGDPPVVLIGHSFGTQVALEAYRLRRRGVKAIVFLCGSYGRITHTFKNTALLAELLPSLTDFVARHPKLARGLWSRIPARAAVRIARMTGDVDARALRPADLEPYFDHVAHVDFSMFLRMLTLAGEHSAEDLLPDLEVPVLIVAGDKDSFTPPAISRGMAKVIPRAELLMIPGATHVAPIEHDELIALKIENFLVENAIL